MSYIRTIREQETKNRIIKNRHIPMQLTMSCKGCILEHFCNYVCERQIIYTAEIAARLFIFFKCNLEESKKHMWHIFENNRGIENKKLENYFLNPTNFKFEQYYNYFVDLVNQEIFNHRQKFIENVKIEKESKNDKFCKKFIKIYGKKEEENGRKPYRRPHQSI